MLNNIWLIICAMSFGGIMEKQVFLNKITSSLLEFVSSQKSLFLTTTGTCMFLNVTASDRYLAIVVPEECLLVPLKSMVYILKI